MMLAAGVLALMSAIVCQDQEGDKELRRELRRLREDLDGQKQELDQQRKRNAKLESEFSALLNYVSVPKEVVSLAALWTAWDHDLDLGSGKGLAASVDSASGKGSGLKNLGFLASFRYWRSEDDISGDEAEIWSLGFLGLGINDFPLKGMRLIANLQVVRFDSLAPGGDADTGWGGTLGMRVLSTRGWSVRLSAYVLGDLVRTSFNHHDTQTIQAVTAAIALELGF